LHLCNIYDIRRQIIGTLSKGYCQRVGLADALLSNPDVLILDEPTIGLDPNQIRQTRRTIRDLSEQHTILLSTHILQEVEAICERAVIIDDGRIIADDAVANLSSAGGQTPIYVEIQAPSAALRETLTTMVEARDVTMTEQEGWCCCTIEPTPNSDLRENVFRMASRKEWIIRELTLKPPKLEEVFHRLTLKE
ncbi:MAG: ATP-binding cassette domain-containing protein, partial [Planctomycetota bacterium]